MSLRSRSRPQLEGERLLLRGAVGRIGVVVGVVAHVVDGPLDLLLEIALPRHEQLPEVLQLLVAHVLFVGRCLVGLEAFDGQGVSISSHLSSPLG